MRLTPWGRGGPRPATRSFIALAVVATVLVCTAAHAQSDSIHAFVVGRHETTGVSLVVADSTRQGPSDSVAALLATDLSLQLDTLKLAAGRYRLLLTGDDTLTVNVEACGASEPPTCAGAGTSIGAIRIAPDSVSPSTDHFTASFRTHHNGPDTLGVEWDRGRSARIDESTMITLPGSTTSLVFRRGWLRWTLPLTAR